MSDQETAACPVPRPTDVKRAMGWERVELGHWRKPNGAIVHITTQPTVDDLLVWLLDNGPEWINVNNAYDENGTAREWQVSAANVFGDGYNEPSVEYDRIEACGMSMLAALERLVLLVAASTQVITDGSGPT